MSDNDSVKPDVKAEGSTEHISIKVTDSNTEVYFKIKKTTQLKKVMDTFCKRTGKDPSALRFLYEGERVQPDDTPSSLDLSDGDTIEALSEQVGGF
ncbi:ubiquitin-like protein Smt3p [Trichomonascus vanleenenianus]|uniref:SUMO family protein SMT3 n=1 Tax=Trichomonascus vanleenenianus TaxID=2268995 RepID=UPI003ECA2492